MAAVSLSTAGILVGYAAETVAGQRPTSGYVNIPRAMSLPSFNSSPSTIDVTSLTETSSKVYVPGLRDVSSAQAIKFSLNNEFKQTWETLMAAFEAAKAENKQLWMEFWIPDMTDAWYFQFEPTELGFGGAEVDAHLEIDAYVTPTGEQGFFPAVKPNVTE